MPIELSELFNRVWQALKLLLESLLALLLSIALPDDLFLVLLDQLIKLLSPPICLHLHLLVR